MFQLVWLNPVDNHELLWDDGMCVDTSRGAAVRDLIAKALKGPLAPAQQEVLIHIFNCFIISLNICTHVYFYLSVQMLNEFFFPYQVVICHVSRQLAGAGLKI